MALVGRPDMTAVVARDDEFARPHATAQPVEAEGAPTGSENRSPQYPPQPFITIRWVHVSVGKRT